MALGLFSDVAHAATYTVTTTADSSVGSLREAINNAQGNASDDTINFAVTGTIRLVGSLPNILNAPTYGALTIQGPSGGITINGDANNSGSNDLGDVPIFKVFSGNLTLNSLTLSGGREVNDRGGGAILNFGGTVSITNSTLSNNVGTDGGAIHNAAINAGGTITISNSTFSGNRATDSGGAIYTDRGFITITSSTISGNEAQRFGGGIANFGTTTLKNSIVAGNSDPNGPPSDNIGRGVTDGGNNLTSGDPLLGPLANNGGPTQTRALLAGSPALDVGQADETTDQRGVIRPQGGADDIGAFEFSQALTVLPSISIRAASVLEGNTSTTIANFTVTLSPSASTTVSVDYATADGTATQPGDYTFTSGTLVFAPGETTKTITVPVKGDSVIESDETFTVNLSNPTNSSLADAQGTGTIVNDDLETPSLVVTTTSDTSTNSDGVTSLREAINLANSNAGADTISFNIPGDGVQTIQLVSPLPVLSGDGAGTIIDGYSQPGASANTLTTGNNAVLKIEIKGVDDGRFAAPMQIETSNCTVKGLVINSGFAGVIIQGNGATGNTVAGNFIGTNASGTVAVANTFGVFIIDAPGNTIGGTSSAARNLLSGNSDSGVIIQGITATGNTVAGNFIGTNAAGTAAIANTTGVLINSTTQDTLIAMRNTIGGTSGAARNLISGNTNYGVLIVNSGTTANSVLGNYIGTNASGTAAIGNAYGIYILDAASNTIGATQAGSGNLISGNSIYGVAIVGANGTGTGNSVRGNSIYANGTEEFQLGIELYGGFGVDANDAGDTDSGANNGQNYPVLTAVSSSGGITGISGNFDSTPNTSFVFDFYSSPAADTSGFGEGQTHLGSNSFTTGDSGTLSFGVSLTGITVPAGYVITATATRTSPTSATGTLGDTSEFSQAFQVLPSVSIGNASVSEGNTGTSTASFTVTLSSASTQPVTISYSTSDGTTNPATAGSDYVAATNATLIVPSGSTTGTISITVNGDTAIEANETFWVTLNSSTNAIIDTGVGFGTIVNDDFNQAPVNSVPPSATTPQDTPLVFSTANGNRISISDADSGNGPLTVTLTALNGRPALNGTPTGVTQSGSAGTLILNGNLTNLNAALDGLSFIPAPNYKGTSARLTITTDDNGNNGGSALSDTDAVPITVSAVNRAPIARPDSASLMAGSSVTFDVLGNDSDPDGDALSIGTLSTPSKGTVVKNANNTLTYSNNGVSGNDSFSYVLRDGQGGTASGTVSLSVTGAGAGSINDITNNPVGTSGGGLTYNVAKQRYVQQVTLKNNSATPITTPLFLVLDQLSANATLFNKSGNITNYDFSGSPYLTVPGGLAAGATKIVTLEFVRTGSSPITYTSRVLTGTGTP